MQNQKREVKILISCDCQGRLESLMGKSAMLQEKNRFDLMLLSGDVCHSRAAPYISALRQQQEKIAMPAYFIDNSETAPVFQKLYPHGLEIAPNLHFLGTYGVTKVKEMVIAFFSVERGWENKLPEASEIEQFLELCKGRRIDILLTNEWPKEIKDISKKEGAITADYVSRLAAVINPHYHIAASGNGFYRMPPYINSEGFLTHFISVAPFEENPKDKYLFGLTVKPGQEEIPTTTNNAIQNPYQALESSAEQVSNPASLVRTSGGSKGMDEALKSADFSQIAIFFEGFPDWCRNSDITEFLQQWGEIKTVSVARELVKGCRSGLVRYRDPECTKSCLESSEKVLFHTKRIKFSRRTLRESQRNEDCWFCKSKGDESLIIYEGKSCYVSLEKGPLCRFHLQIVPFNHVETTGRLETSDKEEIEHCAKVISGYFLQNGYEVIEYERYLPLSEAINHTVMHIVPIKEGKLLKKFQELNSKDNLGFKPLRQEFRKAPFFIKAKINNIPFIKEINKKERVQADFMRIILSQMLDNPRLVNWKQCIRGEEEIKKVQEEMLSILKAVGLIEQQ